MPITVRARMSIAGAMSTMLVTTAAVAAAAPAGAVIPNRAVHVLATTTRPACPSKAKFLRLERRQDNPDAHRVTQRECVRRWAAITVADGHGNAFPSLFHYTAAHRWKWRDRFSKQVCQHVPRRIHWVCVGA